MKAMNVTEQEWFKLLLRTAALESKSDGLTYRFLFSTKPDGSIFVECDVYYDPDVVGRGMEGVSLEDRKEFYLNWRKRVLRMIDKELEATPALASDFSVERQLRFRVREGYGMGSKTVFEI